MKSFLLILVCMFLSACSPTINGAHVERAVKNCEKHGGVASLNTPTFFAVVDMLTIYSVECVDGKKFNIARMEESK